MPPEESTYPADWLEGYEPDLKQFRRLCAEVTAYYFQERYPIFGARPDEEEVRANLEQARELVARIERLM